MTYPDELRESIALMERENKTLDDLIVNGGRCKVTCADGFTMSVIAHAFAYCTPRNNYGPYKEVEVGFPSQEPEPWEQWQRYVESEEAPTETVYSYTPVSLVQALIDHHGGYAK